VRDLLEYLRALIVHWTRQKLSKSIGTFSKTSAALGLIGPEIRERVTNLIEGHPVVASLPSAHGCCYCVAVVVNLSP
jgi:hypothetical protein